VCITADDGTKLVCYANIKFVFSRS
jgi:hypothetical protein